jgi:hypothetical protein
MAMVGVGGAYNSSFIIIKSEMPPEWLEQTINLSFAIMTLFCSLVPYFALLPMPGPVWIAVSSLVYS